MDTAEQRVQRGMAGRIDQCLNDLLTMADDRLVP